MDPRPAHLPDYLRPPINEVVLGIQFAELKQLGSVQAGLFWSRIRPKFPKAVEQPQLPRVFEIFGGAEQRMIVPGIEVSQTAPMNRYWFIDNGDAELIQIQRDRFLHNWRKTQVSTEYPHFEAISESFKSSVALFEQFLEEENLGRLECNQCEVTYINHIPVNDGEGFALATARVFGEWFAVVEDPFKSLEDAAVAMKYRLSLDGKLLGRLHVSVQPAVLVDGSSIVVMELTARGRPLSTGSSGYLQFMRHAREAIVFKFTELTSKAMHEYWGRTK